MNNVLNNLLGPNWRSSTSGVLTVIAVVAFTAIHSDNSLVSFLPNKLEEYVLGFSKLIAIVSGIIFALTVKDSHVTGGDIPQTVEAKSRVQKIEKNLAEKAGRKTYE
jgi:hypothetical protein